jgi:hypothetical protein
MDKNVLKERLDELKRQIKLNSKDAHFADKLIGELLLVKGQMAIEPLELDCGKKEDEYKGETYRITLTNKGVLYHEYGGYNIFVTPNNKALYETLADIVINKDENAKAEGEARERIELMMSAIGYCLTLPKIAFTDAEFAFEIATKVIEFIRAQYDDLMSTPLQEETPKEDEVFKNASLALEDVKKATIHEK